MTCTAESVFPPRRRAPRGLTGALFTASALLAPSLLAGAAVFNIRDYGASGRRTDDARASIQQASPFDQAQHALDFRRVRDLKLKDVEVLWGWPILDSWKSALNFEEVKGLEMSGVVCQAAPAPANAPAMSFDRVAGALVRGCRALDNTRVFLRVTGPPAKTFGSRATTLPWHRSPARWTRAWAPVRSLGWVSKRGHRESAQFAYHPPPARLGRVRSRGRGRPGASA